MKNIFFLLFLMSFGSLIANDQCLNLKREYHTHQINTVIFHLDNKDENYKISLINDTNGVIKDQFYYKPSQDVIFDIPVFTSNNSQLGFRVFKQEGYDDISGDILWNNIQVDSVFTFDVKINFQNPIMEILTPINYTRPYSIKVTGWDNPNILPKIDVLQTGIISETNYSMQLSDLIPNGKIFTFILNINSRLVSFRLNYNEYTFCDSSNILVGYNNIEQTISRYDSLLSLYENDLFLLSNSLDTNNYWKLNWDSSLPFLTQYGKNVRRGINNGLSKLELDSIIIDSLDNIEKDTILNIGNIYFNDIDISFVNDPNWNKRTSKLKTLITDNKVLDLSKIKISDFDVINYSQAIKLGIKIFDISGSDVTSNVIISNSNIQMNELLTNNTYFILLVTDETIVIEENDKQLNRTIQWFKLIVK